ncbi:putative glucose-6-phosphate 1-epimerase [Pecten maximus]|uniref:putative glucose-6-phosphate 1-epimerase n=1 Tax=Pecten maximus TaxID=6579 RepID=UPI001458E4DA|nr:putative glucose-6-phosphate 1-epimerase [Pecten maximus]
MDAELAGRVQEGDIVILDVGDGTSAVVHLHGATALSWKCSGQEILFLSKKAVLDSSKAIRGGIPLVFPQFGPWSCGPQHGFARNKRWSVESQPQKTGDGTVTCSLALSDDEDTRKAWDYRFKLVYTLELSKSSLTTRLTVDNTGDESFTFTTLMHSYFLTPDIGTTTVHGLKGLTYVDKVQNGQFQEDREAVSIPENYDRVYQKCPSSVFMECSTHSVSVNLSNFPDVVVWNPWSEKAKAMSDFGDEEYKTMVCVEAGSVSSPVQIDVGQKLSFQQTLQVQAKL